MPAGMEVYDAASTLLMGVTTSLSRTLGSFQPGTSNGSITDPGLATGVPWYSMGSVSASNDFPNIDTYSPLITISGTTISWTWPRADYKPDTRITYGVY